MAGVLSLWAPVWPLPLDVGSVAAAAAASLDDKRLSSSPL